MNCKQYRVEIEESDFAGGSEAAHSGSHAAGCAECRSFREEAAKLRGLVAGLARVDAPPDFEFRLRARMSAAGTERPRAWTQNLLPRAAWLAAAGSLALAGALALQTRDPQPNGARVTSAQPTAEQTVANTTATTAATTSADATSRGAFGEERGEATAAELTAASLESDEAFVAPRKVRAASSVSASVAAASAAKFSARRLAAEASAGRPEGEMVAPGGARVERTETRTMAMTGSPVIVTSSIPLPVSADERPLQVLFKDTQGASRVVNVDPVAFGSNEPAARPTNVTFTKAQKKQGVW